MPDANKIDEIFRDCLFRDDEPPLNPVLAEGITANFGFQPDRLASHAEAIREQLFDLPANFMKSSGGGYTFLDACQDRSGEQWTSDHRTMEQLFVLGIAIGVASFPLPRPMWSILPGGVPYVTIDDSLVATSA